MVASLTVTFRHIPRSNALESCARDIGLRLQSLNARITACHIVLEGDAGPHAGATRCSAMIHLSVPGAQIHAESGPQPSDAEGDVASALRGAYANARRQLDRLKRRD